MMNPQNFIKKNYDWLIKWIENAQPLGEPNGMQIFKNSHRLNKVVWEKLDESEIKKLFDKKMIIPLKKEHLYNILLAAVFSVNSTIMALAGSRITFMEGFVNKFNRLPTKNDKVIINYLEGNGITRWMKDIYGLLPADEYGELFNCDHIKSKYYIPFYLILSECKVNFSEVK